MAHKMLNRLRLTSLCTAVVLALSLAACGDDEASTSLNDREYLLESSEGFEPVEGTTVRLSFQKGELSFSAGCNSHFGSYKIEGGRLRVDGLGATEIGCNPPLQQQDEWLAAFFTSRPKLERSGDRLTLTGEQATLVFLAREVADPDRPLVGTRWTVDSYIKDDAVSDFPVQRAPTLSFGEDGKVVVSTGCNEAQGRYEVQGNKLTFAVLPYTEIACSPESQQAAEKHVQSVLREGSATFEIEAARLTITRSDGLGIGATAP